jgi:hypothetical protein
MLEIDVQIDADIIALVGSGHLTQSEAIAVQTLRETQRIAQYDCDSKKNSTVNSSLRLVAKCGCDD